MKIIFQKKKTSGGCTLYLTTRRRRNFYARIHIKYNKILSDLVFDNNKKPGCTSQHIQEKIKLWTKTNYIT